MSTSYVDLDLSRSPTMIAPENGEVNNLPVLRVVFATPPAGSQGGSVPASLQISPAASRSHSQQRRESPPIAPDQIERGRSGVRHGTSVSSVSTVATGNASVLPKHPNTREHAVHHVSKVNTNWLLVILFFTSGLIDSVAFNSWSCFVGMQTGEFLPSE